MERELRLPRGEVVTMALYRLGLPLAMLGYLFALGASRIRLIAFVLFAALALVFLAAGTRLVQIAWLGPHPALTAEGIRLRQNRFGRLRLVRWPEVHLVWAEERLGNRSLAVLVRGDGAGRVRFLPLPVGTWHGDELASALSALSGGEVSLSDRGPEDDGRDLPRGARIRPNRRGTPVRAVPLRRVLLGVPVWLLLLPVLFALPEPWNQPWWPGGHRALTAPDPCTVLSADVASTLFAGTPTARSTANSAGRRTCTIEGNGITLVVTYSVHTALLGSSIAKADDFFQTGRPVGAVERLPLGDGAWIGGKAPGSSAIYLGPSQQFVGRSGNVVLEIIYTGRGDPAVVRPAVVAVGTRALNAIRFT